MPAFALRIAAAPVLLSLLALALPSRADAQAAGALAGFVVELTGRQPVHGAELRLAPLAGGAERRARADSTGAFLLAGLAAGEHLLRVRALGFGPESVVVRIAGDTLRVRITLAERPLLLDAVVTSGLAGLSGHAALRLERMGWTERRKQGFGWFLDRRDVERAGNSWPMLLRGQLRGCSMIFVDGVRLRGLRDVSFDEVIGVEIYRRNVHTPVQFRNPVGDCGSIVVWTTIPGAVSARRSP